MQEERICSTTKREDDQVECAVLSTVLVEHPTLLTLGDVVAELDHRSEEAVTRAVRRLVAVGLLRREGSLVLATRAALTFDRMEEV